MKLNNENRQENLKNKLNSNADRDGKFYRKSDRKDMPGEERNKDLFPTESNHIQAGKKLILKKKENPFSKAPTSSNRNKKSRDYSSDRKNKNDLILKKNKNVTSFPKYEKVNYNKTSSYSSRGENDRKDFHKLPYSQKKQLEYNKKNIDYSKPIRLNKFLSNAGVCSRREADEFIKAGVISVNGQIVTEMGTKVMRTDKIMFRNQEVHLERKVYILLNKPKDCVTTSDDPHARLTVMDFVKNACSERIYPVGRLDRNTTGVLLLTNDGDLAAKLTHPKYDKKKIYQLTLDKSLTQQDYENIKKGVALEDEELVEIDALEFIKEGDKKQLGIEIHSGQNHVVRRIFEKYGYKVVRLDRVYFAGLTKKNLPRGKYRFLTQKEVNMLKMGAYE